MKAPWEYDPEFVTHAEKTCPRLVAAARGEAYEIETVDDIELPLDANTKIMLWWSTWRRDKT